MNNDPRAMSFIYNIDRVSNEIKRLNTRLKELREIKKNQEKLLLSTMKYLNLDSAGNYTKKSLEKKYNSTGSLERVKRPKNVKISEAMELCREIGIPDPQKFIEEYKKTQRSYDC